MKLGKNKNSGTSYTGYILEWKKFSCGHVAYTNPDRKDCPHCKIL
jgi:rubrerythrin